MVFHIDKWQPYQAGKGATRRFFQTILINLTQEAVVDTVFPTFRELI